ncbi:Transcriptional regulator, LysR family, partial [hydrothermal vent metagenome]
MQLRNLELFCEVASRHSISKAAEACEVSQSSASQAMNQLEKRLGTQLIDRSKRPLELTSAGQVYFEGCRSILRSIRKLEERVQGVDNKVTGALRIGAIYSVGLLQMGTYIREYRERYPEVKLTLDYLHPDDVYSRVIQKQIDLGIVSFPRDGGEVSCVHWQNQKMMLAVHPDHPFAKKKTISINEISGENYVTFDSELRIRRRIDRWLRESKINMNIVHEFDNIENIKRAVEIGTGITILPLATIQREVNFHSLVAVELNDVEWERPLGVVHKRHKKLTRAAEHFVTLLQEHQQGVAPNNTTNLTNGNRTNGKEKALTSN